MNVPGMVSDGLNAPFTGPLLSDMTATADGVGVGQSHLTAQEIRDMESILRTGVVGYAYVYPLDGESPKVSVFNMTPKNMANFIGTHGSHCRQIVMTDRLDMLLLNTIGEFIDTCPDKQLLKSVLEHLVPIQFGEVAAKEVTFVTWGTYDRYDTVLEEVRKGLSIEDLKQAELSARNTVGHFCQPGYDVSAYPYLEAKWIGEKNLRSCELVNTPENLAAFIRQKKDAEEISIRDPEGTELIIARKGCVVMCLDEAYLKNQLQPALAELRRCENAPMVQDENTLQKTDMKMVL